jgi:hypothetical protein
MDFDISTACALDRVSYYLAAGLAEMERLIPEDSEGIEGEMEVEAEEDVIEEVRMHKRYVVGKMREVLAYYDFWIVNYTPASYV